MLTKTGYSCFRSAPKLAILVPSIKVDPETKVESTFLVKLIVCCCKQSLNSIFYILNSDSIDSIQPQIESQKALLAQAYFE